MVLYKYPSDSLRYHLISNGPEKKDTNFTPEDFINTHNGEIVNKFGNLINRTLKFKGIETIKLSTLDEEVKEKIINTYGVASDLIEKLEFREASRNLMELVEFANKYYDEKEPWKQKKEEEEGFYETIFNCSTIIANLANLYEPIMPEACKKIRKYLKLEEPKWEPIFLEKEIKLENIEPLFERLKLEE